MNSFYGDTDSLFVCLPEHPAVFHEEEAGIHHGRDVEHVMTPSGPVPIQLIPKELDVLGRMLFIAGN